MITAAMARTLVLAVVAGAILGVAGAYGAMTIADGAPDARSAMGLQGQLLLERLHRDAHAPAPAWSARR